MAGADAPPGTQGPAPDHEALSRAVATFESVTAPRLYRRRRGLYGNRRIGWHRSYEALWPFANTWSAFCALASLPGQTGPRMLLPSFVHGLGAYHRDHAAAMAGSRPVGFESTVVPPLGSGGEIYFDDNAWVGLALVRHHERSGDRSALALAVRLLAFVSSGWSPDPTWEHPGGIRWKAPASSVSRNTCTNGPAAELGALVHQYTGDAGAVARAARVYDWTRGALLGGDGLYGDRIAPDGRRSPDVWSYNQGTMIGAGVLLAQVTGDVATLEHAQETAAASLRRFDLAALIDRHGPAFNAIFFRNLLLLDQVVPDPAYRALAAAYGEEMWTRHRDRTTGLFRSGGSLLNTSAPMIEIYSLLAGAPPRP